MTRLLPDLIETGRLRLCHPGAADAETIFESYATDARVCRYLVFRPHDSMALTKRFIAECIASWAAGDRFPYILVEKSAGTLLGMLDARIHGHSIDIGYVLAAKYWGHGLMAEAIGALTDRALSQPAIFRIQATCDVENTASARVLEKCGFSREGRLSRYMVHPNLSAEPRDCIMYARTK